MRTRQLAPNDVVTSARRALYCPSPNCDSEPMTKILMPLPARDFDPTETGVPWRVLTERGHDVVLATPDSQVGAADPLIVTGKGLDLLGPFLRANADGQSANAAMAEGAAFRRTGKLLSRRSIPHDFRNYFSLSS